MELGLSLGHASKPFNGFMDKARQSPNSKALGFCMGLSVCASPIATRDDDEEAKSEEDHDAEDPPLQLELLPNTPVPRHPHGFLWPSSDNGSSEAGSSGQMGRGLDVNRTPAAEEEAAVSSPNSAASSFQMDLWTSGGQKRYLERDSSRASDEDDNGNTKKKLRLSKEQSAFLEESFKEHNTLNPKQKLALAKQLNLRPRQVEVWFQNRRARTKLKQTEVDCEYLKRCCETLTEENRRLHKELQDLRALKTSNPFHMQLPATTLTMCPSCERVATSSAAPDSTPKPAAFLPNRPRFYPFPHSKNPPQPQT